MKDLSSRIVDMLPMKKDGRITISRLQDVFGVSEPTVKDAIRKARKEGALIGADMCGYYLAENQEELADFYRMMTEQAREGFRTVRAMKNGGV